MVDFDVLLSYFIDCLLQCYGLFHAYSHKKKKKRSYLPRSNNVVNKITLKVLKTAYTTLDNTMQKLN